MGPATATPALEEQKRGEVRDGVLTEEVLDSSKSILQSARGSYGTVKGVQQWFTPPPVAQFIGQVIGRYTPTIDLTAGGGHLLEPIHKPYRYGIEIDRDLTLPSKATYTAIRGDAQRAVPMLRAIGARFPGVVLNPPFGLDWTDKVHGTGKINSSRLAFNWAIDLLEPFGQGAIICPTSRLDNDVIRSNANARGIYAILDVQTSMWPGKVTTPCSIAFFIHPDNVRGSRLESQYRTRFEVPDMRSLGEFRSDVLDARHDASQNISQYRGKEPVYEEQVEAIRDEYEHRRLKQEGKKTNRQPFDVTLKGKRISASPSAFSRLALAKVHELRTVELLNGQNVSYFGQNRRAWDRLLHQVNRGRVTLDPKLKDMIPAILEQAKILSTPLFKVKTQMRLGWCDELDKIKCIKNDPARGFSAGSEYGISTSSKMSVDIDYKPFEKKDGSYEVRKFERTRKLLRVTIDNHTGETHQFDESKENIKYLIEHFEIPDPGDVDTHYPEKVEKNREILRKIATDNGFTFKPFQLEHDSRLMTKGRGMLAHEQGLGKTLQGMALAKASVELGSNDKALFVIPQDLIPQWQRECKRFFGRELEVIASPDAAERVRKRLDAGGTGWFVTYFEALSVVGRKQQKLPMGYERENIESHKERMMPARPAVARIELQNRLAYYKAKKHGTEIPQDRKLYMERFENIIKYACPECGTDTAHGWTQEVCRKDLGGCGYVHRRFNKKGAYSRLTKCFRDGIVVCDEVSEIRGDDSLRSKVIRALQRGYKKVGAFRWGLTGTPLSNFISDSFWGLWWCLGNASLAFPYDYRGGKAKFEEDFCVIEHMFGSQEKGEDHRRVRRKVLPMVTNVSMFWRLTQPSISRCRKEQTGEKLVPRIFHPIQVPQGIAQIQSQKFWLEKFPDYFIWKHPDHDLVLDGGYDLIERLAATLGQNWRLEFASTLPAYDEPTMEWPVAQAETAIEGLSNYTPATLKVLELAIEHVKKGEKVLIGSDLIRMGTWFSERLQEKGIKAIHITEEKDGKTGTKSPKKRAKEIRDFVEGDAQVLCAGVGAMKLGHNLDCASTVIVHGLPYSHMVMDQFLARVHRLSSKKDVDVYVVVPQGSIAERKWQLLKDKSGSADLAFDGELMEQQEEAVDQSKILKEMKEAGIKIQGDEVLEADVEAAWQKVPKLPPPKPKPKAPTHRHSPDEWEKLPEADRQGKLDPRGPADLSPTQKQLKKKKAAKKTETATEPIMKRKGGLYSSLGIDPKPVPKTKKARERQAKVDEVMPSLF